MVEYWVPLGMRFFGSSGSVCAGHRHLRVMLGILDMGGSTQSRCQYNLQKSQPMIARHWHPLSGKAEPPHL